MQTIPFAKQMVMVTRPGTTATVITDPVALGDYNFGSAIPYVHYGVGTTPTYDYTCQVSNDGVNWVAQGPSATSVAATAGVGVQTSGDLNGQFVRCKIDFDLAATPDEAGAVCLDLLVVLDRVNG